MGMGFLSGVMNVLERDRGGVAEYCKHTKCPWISHLKMVNFVLCEFHINKLFLKQKNRYSSEEKKQVAS